MHSKIKKTRAPPTAIPILLLCLMEEIAVSVEFVREEIVDGLQASAFWQIMFFELLPVPKVQQPDVHPKFEEQNWFKLAFVTTVGE